LQGTVLGGAVRFKSQALLEDKALLACMAYVDLNPIRAGLSATLEGSDHTSMQERIQAYVQTRESYLEKEFTSPASIESVMKQGSIESSEPLAPLMDFTGVTGDEESGLPFYFSDYLELVDWTGRVIGEDKRCSIPADVPPILTRLGLEAQSWIETVRHYRRHFYDYVGPADVMTQCSHALGRSWLRGVGACRKLLGEGRASPQAAAFAN